MGPERQERLPPQSAEIESLLERVQHQQLSEQDFGLLERLLRLLLAVARLLEQKQASLARLRRLLFGSPPEPPPAPPPPASPSPVRTDQETAPPPEGKRRGPGRRSSSDYSGAVRVRCNDPQRQAGDRCTCGGRLYHAKEPAVFLRFTGQPLVGATRYEQTVLRCSGCQQRFTAPLPDGVPAEKYDATADVAMVIAKYAAGLPFHRLARMQQSLGVPLAESVQWERCEAVADALLPIYRHFPQGAAQADVLIGDDTRVQILSCEAENQQRAAAGERCGLHTTGLVAQSPVPTQHTIVL
jgi:transposase